LAGCDRRLRKRVKREFALFGAETRGERSPIAPLMPRLLDDVAHLARSTITEIVFPAVGAAANVNPGKQAAQVDSTPQ
jgi:hypothetical protein